MTKGLSPATATRLEKVAVDNGFEQALPCDAGWMGFASTHAPLRIWLTAIGDDFFVAAMSQAHVAHALADHGTLITAPMPDGAAIGRSATSIPALHQMIRRAFQLSRTLPDELLHAFEKQTATLSKTTEAERLTIQRIGQDIFRAGLLDYWEGRCAITGLSLLELLRASHIKPWAACDSDAERLDIYNGLLLAPHLDAAFDRGLITVADDGAVIVSSAISPSDRSVLGLGPSLSVGALADEHRRYLAFHRDNVFRKPTAGSYGESV